MVRLKFLWFLMKWSFGCQPMLLILIVSYWEGSREIVLLNRQLKVARSNLWWRESNTSEWVTEIRDDRQRFEALTVRGVYPTPTFDFCLFWQMMKHYLEQGKKISCREDIFPMWGFLWIWKRSGLTGTSTRSGNPSGDTHNIDMLQLLISRDSNSFCNPQ